MISDTVLQATTQLVTLAGLHAEGRHQEALAVAVAALDTVRLAPGDDVTIVGAARASIASYGVNAALELERHQEALGFAELEVAAAESIPGDSVSRARGLMDRALALERLGRLDAAAVDYSAASRIVERLAPQGGVVDELRHKLAFNLGDLQVSRGEVQVGLQALTTSSLAPVEGSDAGHGRDQAVHLNNLGQVALQLGQLDRARSILERAHAVAQASRWPRAIGIVACNLGMTHLALGSHELALRYLIEARDIHRKARVLEPLARDCYNLASVYRTLGQGEEAVAHLQEAWAAAREVAPHSLLALSILSRLALERMLEHDFARARAILRRGLALYEEIRPDVGHLEAEQQGALEQYRLLLQIHLYLSLEQGWRDEPLELIERGKARFWVEAVASLRSSEATHEKGQWRLASAHLLGELSVVVGPKALMLNFFVGPDATFVAYGTGGSLSIRRLDVSEVDLRDMVQQATHELLASPSRRGRSQTEGRRLAGLLLRDMDIEVGDARVVFVMPDGPLWELPFDALPLLSGDHHLMDVAPVVINPAFHLLAELRRQEASFPALEHWRVLAVGQPDAGPSALAIPGTAEQLQTIRDLLAAAEASTYLAGRHATKAKMLAALGQATHIHLASHAFGSTENNRPHLLLSNGSGEPDMLYADELQGLRLQAELVFLSACSTSLGQVSVGEGLLSLARAFLLNGARCVVGTLWPIADAEAVELIRCFYQRLADGSSVAHALQHARTTVRAQGAAPRTWAAPQLVGDGTAREDPIEAILATAEG